MPNTSELKNKLDDLYDALLKNSESNVKNKFKKVRDALVNVYLVDANKNADGTFTTHSMRCFLILQSAVFSTVVSADSNQRIWATSYTIKFIKRSGVLIGVRESSVVVEFLKNIRDHVNETKFFKDISVETYEVAEDGGDLQEKEGNNRNLRGLIASSDRMARTISSKIAALPRYAGMELTDEEKRVAE